jgi:hypothetical protein
MLGGKSQNVIRPSALGTTLNSGTYGQTIPLLYGRTKGAMYLIWMANLRQGSGKKAKKNKGAPDYVANVDWLLAHNPISTMLQAWVNQNQWLQLNFVEYTVASGFIAPATLTVPDDKLYAVLAVTITIPYAQDDANVVFDDYGAQGPTTLNGSFEMPLWNCAYNGPDPVHASGWRNAPWVYRWTPASGATIQFPFGGIGAYPIAGYDINVYYAQIPNFNEIDTNNLQSTLGLNGAKASADTPVGALNLIFEPSLGDGPEFTGSDQSSGNPLSDQQVVYPHYSGLGSESFAMGSAQAFPQVQPELLGTFPINPTGDADFADIKEDLFYGATQAGFGDDNPQTPIQHGLNCGQRPGTVQQAYCDWEPAFGGNGVFGYPLPNVAGDFLVVVAAAGNSGAPITIADTASNAWTPVFSGDDNIQIWHATAKAWNVNEQGTIVTVTIDWFGESSNAVALLEIAGVDTLDSVVAAAGRTASVTTTGAQGTPMYILGFGDYTNDDGSGTIPPPTLWQNLFNPDLPATAAVSALFRLQYRIVQFPGTYKYTAPTVNAGGGGNIVPENVALLAFKCSQPPNYPPALGNIIGDILDKPSLQIARNQCRAAGLWGSLLLDAQTKGSDIIGQLDEAMDAWSVWSGFSLKTIARSEVSAVGNGAVYIAATAAGPVADLVESDFYTDGSGNPPITVTRKAQVNVPNLLAVQHPNRNSQYNDIVVSQPESGAIALYGPRKDSPKMMRMFQDPAVSRMYLSIQTRLANYVRNGYEFPLNAKWKLLEPGDLVTIPQASTMPATQGPGGTMPVPYVKIPVRILSVEEDEKFGLKFTAEPFIYGAYAPLPLPATAQQGYIPQTGGNPGSVNVPVIFEPVPRLAGGNTQPELWIVTSGGATEGSPPVTPNYGGNFAYISTDGGNSYNPVAPLVEGGSVVGGAPGSVPSNAILGNGITGNLANGWPAAPSPDSANDLSVDLSECHGELESYSVEDEDQFTYPCYVGGGAVSPLYVDSCSTIGVNVASASKVFPNGNNAGNAIFVIVGAYQDMPLGVTVTDSNLNTYTRLFNTAPIANFGPYSEAYVYAAVNVAGGPNTVKVALASGSGDVLWAALEYSDVATVGSPPSGLAVTFSVSQTTGSYPLSVPTGAFAITVGGGLIISFAFDTSNYNDTLTVTPAIGWVLRENPHGALSPWASDLAVWDTPSPNPSAQAVTIDANASGGSGGFHVGAFALQAGNPNVTGIPYELMTYAVAELTGPYQYTLKARPTGSPPEANHLDRGVFGAPAPNQGVLHLAPSGSPPSGGSRFAFVGPPYTGILKLALDPSWIGKTLYFKFAAFNSFLGSVQDLSDCTVYTYTPTGTAGSATGNPASYTVTPTVAGSPPTAPTSALSNPTATTIDMAQVTVQFPSNGVTYNARVFTIPNPTVPTTYYVTITDPGYTGDAPGETNLTAICQTSDALVGLAGNTYIGSIVALPGGGGTVVGPGGSGGVNSFELLVNGS